MFDLDQCRFRSPAAGATLRRLSWHHRASAAGTARAGKNDEASDRVRFTDDRAYRSGTAGASPQLSELLDYKSGHDSAPSGDTSSTREEELAFVIDEGAKTLAFSANRPLIVTRLGKNWISANRDGIFYEFNRQDGTLTYASSTTQDGVTTTIVGSGQCAISPAPIR